jgi:23S rRNA (uracil1939-C5)-methyltransferase
MRDASEAFLINHLDTLGQGVSKMPDGHIMLIPKTLPGESGQTHVIQRKGKVHFAQAPHLLEASSPDRNPSQCAHYQACSGCHFLHTNYRTELKFKREGLKHLFKREGIMISDELLNVEESPERFGYRNRLQLHYDLSLKLLGMIDAKFKIVPIPECLLPRTKVKELLIDLYKDNSWIQLAQKSTTAKSGHVEIFERNTGEVSLSWNERYAAGGFEQVNPLMNERMTHRVTGHIVKHNPRNVLELFGGSGNLTRSSLSKIDYKLTSIDFNPNGKNSTTTSCRFLNLDLYSESSFDKIKASVAKNIDLLILDPPRSGLKQLNQYAEYFTPSKILYVSCWPASLMRDLKSIQHTYKISSVTIMDFFPGTHHFETLVELSHN